MVVCSIHVRARLTPEKAETLGRVLNWPRSRPPTSSARGRCSCPCGEHGVEAGPSGEH